MLTEAYWPFVLLQIIHWRFVSRELDNRNRKLLLNVQQFFFEFLVILLWLNTYCRADCILYGRLVIHRRPRALNKTVCFCFSIFEVPTNKLLELKIDDENSNHFEDHNSGEIRISMESNTSRQASLISTDSQTTIEKKKNLSYLVRKMSHFNNLQIKNMEAEIDEYKNKVATAKLLKPNSKNIAGIRTRGYLFAAIAGFCWE